MWDLAKTIIGFLLIGILINFASDPEAGIKKFISLINETETITIKVDGEVIKDRPLPAP